MHKYLIVGLQTNTVYICNTICKTPEHMTTLINCQNGRARFSTSHFSFSPVALLTLEILDSFGTTSLTRKSYANVQVPVNSGHTACHLCTQHFQTINALMKKTRYDLQPVFHSG